MGAGNSWTQGVLMGIRERVNDAWSVQASGATLVIRGGAGPAALDLADLAARHPQGPDAAVLDEVVARVVRHLALPPRWEQVRAQLVPCLWRSEQLPARPTLLRRPWLAPLWVGYGIAGPACTLAVTTELASGWGVRASDVDAAALANLRASRPPLARVVAGVLYACADMRHPERSAAGVVDAGGLERLARRCGSDRLLLGLPHRGLAVVLRAPREDDPEEVAAPRLHRVQLLTAQRHRAAVFPLAGSVVSWQARTAAPLLQPRWALA